jgi:uncharacterized protein YjbI with pentapeptide repeats
MTPSTEGSDYSFEEACMTPLSDVSGSPPTRDPRREELQDQKLALEIGELQQAGGRARTTARLQALTACLSAATTIIVALVSGYLGYQLQRFGEREQERQHRSELYSTYLTELDSPVQSSARTGAAAGLADIATEDAGKTNQIVTILLAKVETESNATVLRSLIDAVVRIGGPALQEVASVNRSARATYRENATQYILLNRPLVSTYRSTPEAERFSRLNEDIDKASEPLFNAIDSFAFLGILSPSEAKLVGLIRAFTLDEELSGNNGRSLSAPFRRLNSVEREEIRHFSEIIRYFNNLNTPSSLRISNTKDDDLKERATSAARTILVTSTMINRILDKPSMNLDGVSLQKVALVIADLHGKSLPNSDLSGAFIVGDATKANLTRSNLSGADVSQLQLQSAILSFANLEGAQMPYSGRVGGRRPHAAGYMYTADLTGANWWDSTNVQKISSGRISVNDKMEASMEDLDSCPNKPEGSVAGEAGSNSPSSGPDDSRQQVPISFVICVKDVSQDEKAAYEKRFPEQKNRQLREKPPK